jgi:hypothetical protein
MNCANSLSKAQSYLSQPSKVPGKTGSSSDFFFLLPAPLEKWLVSMMEAKPSFLTAQAGLPLKTSAPPLAIMPAPTSKDNRSQRQQPKSQQKPQHQLQLTQHQPKHKKTQRRIHHCYRQTRLIVVHMLPSASAFLLP